MQEPQLQARAPGITIGALARQAGVTVRTLHHYDAIGLLRPSARSVAGYRLYLPQDVQRLHVVLALRQLGLSLPEIADHMARGPVATRALVERQISEARRLLRETHQRIETLALLRDTLRRDDAGESDLVDASRLVAHYERHLRGQRIRRQLEAWRRARPRWQPVAEELSARMQARTDIGEPAVQRLAQRWMNLAMQAFGGNLGTILRWTRMHREAPETARHAGLEPALLAYLENAVGARMQALARHLSSDELQQLDGTTGPAWERLAEDGEALLATGAPPDSAPAKALKKRYLQLLARTVRHDPVVAGKLRAAHEREPILAHGHFVSHRLRAFLDRVPDGPGT
ncbi:MerR family transcriptional regulator [Bordetella sp. 2513F-2]